MQKRVNRWARIKLVEFQRLIGSIKELGPFSILFRFRTLQLLVYTFVYPIARIALGTEGSSRICESLIKTPSLKIFPFPVPMKGRIILKDNKSWSVLIELLINDAYQKNILEKGMNIIDVGAHIGGHTIYFAEKTGPSGKVVAVEPGPENYKNLLENIELNGFKNIIPVEAALSDHNGSENLYLSPWSTGHSLLSESAETNKNSPCIKMQAKTLDSLLEGLNLKKIDLIKIDAEGAEMSILRGAKTTLKNNPHAKIIVASYHYPLETSEVQNFLQSLGFKTKISDFDIVFTI